MSRVEIESGVRLRVDDGFGAHWFRDANCEKHGTFESSAFVIGTKGIDRKPNRWIGCPKCAEDRHAERERMEREEEQRRRLEARIARAGIPYNFRDAELERYIATNADQKRALKFANGYAKRPQSDWECGQSFLLLGNPGTGKTHIAIGIARKAMEQGFSGIFTTAFDMIGKVKATWGQRGDDSETQEAVIERFAKRRPPCGRRGWFDQVRRPGMGDSVRHSR